MSLFSQQQQKSQGISHYWFIIVYSILKFYLWSMIWVKKRLKAVPLIPSLCRWLWNRSSLVRCSDCAGVQPPCCVLKDCSSCVVVSPRPLEILITRAVFFITLVLVICSPTCHTPGRKWQLTRQMQVPGCAVKSHMSIWLYFPSVRGTSILSSLKLQIIEHYIIYRDPWLPPAPPRTGWPPASGGWWQCADQQHGRLTTAEPNFLKYHISNKIKIKIKYKGELA